MIFVCGVFTASPVSGSVTSSTSRLISLGALSSRNPLKEAWRRLPSPDQATKLDFCDKLWLDVVKIAPGKCCQLLREGTFCLRQGFQPVEDHLCGRAGEACSDPADMPKLAILVDAERQRADSLVR